MEEKKIENAPEKEEKKKKRWLLLLLLLLITFCVSSFALYYRGRKKTPASGDTPIPPKIESNAEPIAGDNSDKRLETPDGGGAVSLNYSKTVDIDLTKRKASLVFGNPAKSNQDAIVQLVISNTVILQSGSLTPGTKATELDLAEGAEKKLTAGVYDGKFVVSFYDRATDRWATLNAEIPVTVTVTK